MSKFETGNDPADHTNAEVVDFLKGDEATPDEHERVLEAERSNRARVGILNLSGSDEPAAEPAADPVDDPAGPNEAATGQESPADEAKTVDDPQASGDAGLTADQYPDDAPAALGPDMPQSKAEADAHAATLAQQELAAAEDVNNAAEDGEDRPATQTPAEALSLAIRNTAGYRRPLEDDTDAGNE